MRLQTQAAIFIQTLEDMLQHDRARQKRRLSRQVKTHVDRFMIASRANPEGKKWSQDRATTGTRPDRETATQRLGD
ncbi:hypothetical protein DZD18_04685 [Rhodobacteraceae bacterium W635]|uniref:hypothetical protein n=1 Tax=Nioella halotolerans TaxID=2303578 RepID=UPI000E3BD730|nr:hypothetical protein DZD18_04685 [Rhodobacteraceae bacterium W635]